MDFYKFSKCVYTAQGDMVCENKTFVETFEEEKPNIANANKGSILNNAIENKYCDITAETDPKTGTIKYTFKKECVK